MAKKIEEIAKKHGINYVPVNPTKTQIACNAVRDMFFDRRHYNGVIPVKDMEVVKNSKMWHSVYGRKHIQQAVKELEEEGYMYLDEKKENWLWGLSPEWHEMLFGEELNGKP
jgi:hypothetical protein